jgi:alpha-glucosidase (family GH31 glycosyl hydrolase)
MMRSLWLHYPKDKQARGIGDEYLWGRDMLIAPVYEKDAMSREVYLPAGTWYDWWTRKAVEGGKAITRQVDLSCMPIYVRAGAIIPFDPVRQYTSQKVAKPTTLKIYRGASFRSTRSVNTPDKRSTNRRRSRSTEVPTGSTPCTTTMASAWVISRAIRFKRLSSGTTRPSD